MPGKIPSDDTQKAAEVERPFRVTDGIYVVGCLERGVTVYKQQVRAHNLTWALWELDQKEKVIKRIAVVGGGIAGLTAAACFLSLFDEGSITIFEQRWDLCPLQQGADNRWLHPRIYDWPVKGSRVPSASLPVLNWSEGRASDVARTVLSEFGRRCAQIDPKGDRVEIYVGLGHLRVTASEKRIEWIGNRTKRSDAFFRVGDPQGSSATYDVIVAAPGFGLESGVEGYTTASYWRNDQIAQPILNGTRRSCLISGFGDGALIDLFRLTIERFRQDTILYELFQDAGELEETEAKFASVWTPEKWEGNVFDVFVKAENDKWLDKAKSRLAARIRKDTRVVMHITGRNKQIKSFSDIFGRFSSFLNRLLTYLLYRCGAFAISLEELDTAIHRYGVLEEDVLCRYGADTLKHLQGVFIDFDKIESRLLELKKGQLQSTRLAWKPGRFRNVT
jgi:hypothetical protein